MADTNRITIQYNGQWGIDVPTELLEEARALDARDMSPGDGNLRWLDSPTDAAFTTAYERIARAAVRQVANQWDAEVSLRVSDISLRQEVAAKGRVYNDLRAALASLGPDAPTVRRLQSQNDGTYTVDLSKSLRTNQGSSQLVLTATDTPDTIATKIAISRNVVPAMDSFIASRLAGAAPADQRRIRAAIENLVTHQGLSAYSLADRGDGFALDTDPAARHIARVTAEADGRLVINAPRGTYAGTAELRIDSLGGKPTLTSVWTSADGKRQRTMIYGTQSWSLVRETKT